VEVLFTFTSICRTEKTKFSYKSSLLPNGKDLQSFSISGDCCGVTCIFGALSWVVED
jgi:hypothetical protein